MTPQEQADCERIALYLVRMKNEAFAEYMRAQTAKIPAHLRQAAWDFMPDFYRSEESNAILRDAMLAAGWQLVIENYGDGDDVIIDCYDVSESVKKMAAHVVAAGAMRAIVGAFLRLMEISK